MTTSGLSPPEAAFSTRCLLPPENEIITQQFDECLHFLGIISEPHS